MKLSTRQGLHGGVSFGFCMGLLQGLAHGPLTGLGAGIVGGGLFGLFIGLLLRRKERIWDALREPYDAEGMQHHGPATCAIGHGYLMLTAKRLVWMPTKEKERAKKIIVSRNAIARVDKAGAFPPQIRVVTITGESVRFMVNGRHAWLERLRDVPVRLPEARIVG